MFLYRFIFILFLLAHYPSFAQYYIRGEIKDEEGKPLSHVLITVKSKNEYPYYSGSTGVFGIPTKQKKDTLTFSLNGYESLTCPVDATEYGSFQLKPVKLVGKDPVRLKSIIKNYNQSKEISRSIMGESYAETYENVSVPTEKYPETGFALHVDRASYSNIRRFINQETKPPPDAVRIEEMLNYFNFRTEKHFDSSQTFDINTRVTSCPWNDKNRLFFINLTARKINLDSTPPSNLVFLIDVSASMEDDNKLPLLKSGFKLLVENLREIDTVAIITYSSNVSVDLSPTSGAEKKKIIEAIEGLRPAGSTAGEEAIRLAYKFAKSIYREDGNNRVILATDGDFNVGQTSDKELEELITTQRKTGIYLTCLGVGTGNYKDSKLEILAKKGNGNFAYLDKEQEAEKVLVEEFAQTVYTVANNVFLTVAFNPNVVNEYRLVGFDNRREALLDSSAQLEGGEVGSGQSLLAVFEINLADHAEVDDTSFAGRIATLDLSYKLPGKPATEKRLKLNANYNYQNIYKTDSCIRFATSVIMFGSMLKQSKFAKNIEWKDVERIARSAADKDDLLEMEFIDLVSKAKDIYTKRKKRRGR